MYKMNVHNDNTAIFFNISRSEKETKISINLYW